MNNLNFVTSIGQNNYFFIASIILFSVLIAFGYSKKTKYLKNNREATLNEQLLLSLNQIQEQMAGYNKEILEIKSCLNMSMDDADIQEGPEKPKVDIVKVTPKVVYQLKLEEIIKQNDGLFERYNQFSGDFANDLAVNIIELSDVLSEQKFEDTMDSFSKRYKFTKSTKPIYQTKELKKFGSGLLN